MADVFLSHSSADNDLADQIKSWLERDRANWSVFLDKHPRDGILAGQSWQDRLRSELQSCRLVLAIITPDWLASRWCFTEAIIATFRGKDFVGVLPKRIPDAALETAPPIVHERQRQPLNLLTGAGWEELLHALDRSGLDPSRWFPIAKDVGPYPGFVAFEEKDAGVFFGRDQEITQYLDALNSLRANDRPQALVISGGSGSGKSSLLKAGLIPRLRQQSGWLVISPFDLSREPIHALFAVLRGAAQATGADIDLPREPPRSVEDLTELLQDTLRAIEEKANAWLLLPLDQAEVLLAGSQGENETDAGRRLLASIGQLLSSRTRKLIAVLTIRTEFMPALERALPSAVRLHDRSLRSITALSEIIEKPAARFGIELEEGLTGRMVEDTRGADALPLLAYTLRELNETYGDDQRLTVDEYERLGGVEGAIEKKLDEALSDPEPTREELAAFRRCFVRQLVRVDESAVEGERYLRTAVARDALPDAADRLVDRLLEARLLIGGDEGTIGIAHERLIKNWLDVPLQTWLAEDRDSRKLIDTLRSFLTAHRDGGPLLSEKPLLDAKDLLERDHALKDDEPELARFIEDSDTAERTRQRIRRWLFGGAVAASIVFLVVAVGAVTFFLQAQEQTKLAEEERNRALTAQSKALSSVSREQTDKGQATLGILLALEALPKQADKARSFVPSAEAALLYALFAQREKHVLPDHSQGVNYVRFSPNGSHVVTASRDHTTRLWEKATGKLTATLHGHTGQVYKAEFSPDGERLVTASSDMTARIWDTETGRTDVTLRGHEGDIYQATFSPDGKHVVTASSDKTARIWDVETGKITVALTGHDGEVYTAEFSPNGHQVVTSSHDRTARVWHLSQMGLEGKPRVLHGHTALVIHATFSPDGARIITASWDRTARLWDATTGELIASLEGHEDGVSRSAFSPNGELVVTTSADSTTRLWDGITGKPIAVLKGHKGQVHDARFSPDARWLVTAADDGTARLWDTTTGETIYIFRGHTGRVWSALISSDGQHVATASEDNTARIWEVAPNNIMAELKGHKGHVHRAIFTADGTRVVTVSDDRTARIWDSNTGQTIATLTEHKGELWYAAISADGQRLVTTSADGTARLWDTDTGRLVHTLEGHEGLVNHAHFSPDGQRLVTGGKKGIARVWDAATGKTVARLTGHQGPVNFVEFSHDGDRIVTASQDGTARLWNAATWELIASLTEHRGPVINGAFSPDDRWLVTASWDGTARLWDGISGKAVAVLEGHADAVLSATFSPDSRLVVTASSDNTARIWEAATGKALRVLQGHGGEVYEASFSSDGRLVLTASGDRTARLWHTASGLPVGTLKEHDGSVVSAAFAPDGRHVSTASWDHTARLWQLPFAAGDDWLMYARGNLTRQLTNDERRLYLGE